MKKFISISCLIFISFFVLGYFFSYFFPSLVDLFLDVVDEKLEPLIRISPFGQFLFIIFNNTLTLFLAIFLGVFLGIFPFLILAINGFILGIFAYVFPLTFFIVGIFPHGIIEIPILILSCSWGFKLAKVFFRHNIKEEIKSALFFFLKFLIPLLVLAAFIEIYITAKLLEILI